MNTPSVAGAESLSGTDRPVRIFGWLMLAALAAYLINTVLTLSWGWPGTAAIVSGGGALSAVQLGIWVLFAALAVLSVMRRPDVTLRADAALITAFNLYLVRAAFFGVLFVGLSDTFLSFLRVENLTEALFGADLTRELNRAAFRGVWLHWPLIGLGFIVALRARTLGFPWLALLIVVAELSIVISRFVFSYEQAFMGDLVRFWYAALFLFASAYTLLEEGHVRVDVFYSAFSDKTKGLMNTLGTLFFGFGLCWVILVLGMGSRQSIIYAPLANFEVTQAGFGLFVKYLMAGFLAFFAITMLIQFVSYLMESVADWRGRPGRREVTAPSAH